MTDMSDMFHGATSFDQNLSKWDVSSVKYTNINLWEKGMYNMFHSITLSTSPPNYSALLKGWSKLDLQDSITSNGGIK